MRVTTFPGHVNYVYLVLAEPHAILWDTGSGLERSNAALEAALELVHTVFGEPCATFDRLSEVVISHGHIDHFGGAPHLKAVAPQARLMVHELDARVLENFEERVIVASKDVGVFLQRAGVLEARRRELEEMYRAGKSLFRSVEVDRRLRGGDRVGPFELIHTAGHCPGALCMRVGELLLVGDQVLAPITPHISPQSITPFTGLESYIGSLMRLRLLEGVRTALSAHGRVIEDLGGRIDEILAHHQARLARIMEVCATPRPLVEISEALFGPRDGYDELLAVLEAGAHVEYLNQHGRLGIANLDRVEAERDPVLEYFARA